MVDFVWVPQGFCFPFGGKTRVVHKHPSSVRKIPKRNIPPIAPIKILPAIRKLIGGNQGEPGLKCRENLAHKVYLPLIRYRMTKTRRNPSRMQMGIQTGARTQTQDQAI
jgi:hypothetical protein